MVKGRFIYSFGINSGANLDVRNTENVYAHVGYKVGGMRLDGEGDTGPAIREAVGRERAHARRLRLSLGVALHAVGRPARCRRATVADPLDDLDLGRRHPPARARSARSSSTPASITSGTTTPPPTAPRSTAMAQYDEISYVIFPWLVPAVRFECGSVAPEGGTRINDIKIIPGIAALVLPT